MQKLCLRIDKNRFLYMSDAPGKRVVNVPHKLKYKTLLARSEKFPEGLDPESTYIVTEKKDGVRATWDGKRLLARRGGDLKAPPELVTGLPVLLGGRGETQTATQAAAKGRGRGERGRSIALVGELCAQQGNPDKLKGLVRSGRKTAAQTHEELQTKLFLFDDLSSGEGTKQETYKQRMARLRTMVEKSNNTRLGTVDVLGEVKTRRWSKSMGSMRDRLAQMVARQPEGVVLTQNNEDASSTRVKIKNLKVGVATVLAASQSRDGGGYTVEATLRVNADRKAKAGKSSSAIGGGTYPVSFNVRKDRQKEIFRGATVRVYYRIKKGDFSTAGVGGRTSRVVDVFMV